MAYVEHEWVNGETITAAKLNNIEEGITEAAQSGGGGLSADAVIHLEHANNSDQDGYASLTPTIVSGTYAELKAKLYDGGCPYILVEYHHPWGMAFTMPMGYVSYWNPTSIRVTLAGYSIVDDQFMVFGSLVWADNDTLFWD